MSAATPKKPDHTTSPEGQYAWVCYQYSFKMSEIKNCFEEFMVHAKSMKADEQGELEENQVHKLLEKSGQTMTSQEFRKVMESIDINKNRKVSFLEWACYKLQVTWDDMMETEIKLLLKKPKLLKMHTDMLKMLIKKFLLLKQKLSKKSLSSLPNTIPLQLTEIKEQLKKQLNLMHTQKFQVLKVLN